MTNAPRTQAQPSGEELTLQKRSLDQRGTPEFLTVAEAAKLPKTGRQTIYDSIATGRLPAAHVGKTGRGIRIRRQDIEQLFVRTHEPEPRRRAGWDDQLSGEAALRRVSLTLRLACARGDARGGSGSARAWRRLPGRVGVDGGERAWDGRGPASGSGSRRCT